MEHPGRLIERRCEFGVKLARHEEWVILQFDDLHDRFSPCLAREDHSRFFDLFDIFRVYLISMAKSLACPFPVKPVRQRPLLHDHILAAEPHRAALVRDADLLRQIIHDKVP